MCIFAGPSIASASAETDWSIVTKNTFLHVKDDDEAAEAEPVVAHARSMPEYVEKELRDRLRKFMSGLEVQVLWKNDPFDFPHWITEVPGETDRLCTRLRSLDVKAASRALQRGQPERDWSVVTKNTFLHVDVSDEDAEADPIVGHAHTLPSDVESFCSAAASTPISFASEDPLCGFFGYEEDADFLDDDIDDLREPLEVEEDEEEVVEIRTTGTMMSMRRGVLHDHIRQFMSGLDIQVVQQTGSSDVQSATLPGRLGDRAVDQDQLRARRCSFDVAATPESSQTCPPGRDWSVVTKNTFLHVDVVDDATEAEPTIGHAQSMPPLDVRKVYERAEKAAASEATSVDGACPPSLPSGACASADAAAASAVEQRSPSKDWSIVTKNTFLHVDVADEAAEAEAEPIIGHARTEPPLSVCHKCSVKVPMSDIDSVGSSSPARSSCGCAGESFQKRPDNEVESVGSSNDSAASTSSSFASEEGASPGDVCHVDTHHLLLDDDDQDELRYSQDDEDEASPVDVCHADTHRFLLDDDDQDELRYSQEDEEAAPAEVCRFDTTQCVLLDDDDQDELCYSQEDEEASPVDVCRFDTTQHVLLDDDDLHDLRYSQEYEEASPADVCRFDTTQHVLLDDDDDQDDLRYRQDEEASLADVCHADTHHLLLDDDDDDHHHELRYSQEDEDDDDDDEEEDALGSSPLKRRRRKRVKASRPSKGLRDRIRKFINALEAQVLQQPDSFDFTSVVFPRWIAENPAEKERLRARLECLVLRGTAAPPGPLPVGLLPSR